MERLRSAGRSRRRRRSPSPAWSRRRPSGAIPTIGHIGRYALKYQLGEGGLGTVFAAHDPLLSRLIAVKTLNVEVADEERESFNALFLNEARAAGGLSHPHIVTVFDAGISDQRAYIAMELLKGRDLRQLRQEGWRATPAQAALIVRRVADALAFAHSKGVIHRDIKPANIFMVGRTQPRVLDFGIARVAHQQDGGDPHSGAGSPYYMAPEQVRREPVDRRADVFSLGVVLYELLTDIKPFRGESLAQIRDAVLNHEPPLASKVDPTVPKALAAIAARAMAKDPEQRFRSARSFARELRQWLDDNPASADGEKTAPCRGAARPAQPRGARRRRRRRRRRGRWPRSRPGPCSCRRRRRRATPAATASEARATRRGRRADVAAPIAGTGRARRRPRSRRPRPARARTPMAPAPPRPTATIVASLGVPAAGDRLRRTRAPATTSAPTVDGRAARADAGARRRRRRGADDDRQADGRARGPRADDAAARVGEGHEGAREPRARGARERRARRRRRAGSSRRRPARSRSRSARGAWSRSTARRRARRRRSPSSRSPKAGTRSSFATATSRRTPRRST